MSQSPVGCPASTESLHFVASAGNQYCCAPTNRAPWTVRHATVCLSVLASSLFNLVAYVFVQPPGLRVAIDAPFFCPNAIIIAVHGRVPANRPNDRLADQSPEWRYRPLSVCIRNADAPYTARAIVISPSLIEIKQTRGNQSTVYRPTDAARAGDRPCARRPHRARPRKATERAPMRYELSMRMTRKSCSVQTRRRHRHRHHRCRPKCRVTFDS